ncbi:TetR/AcrR family transcriptional regulator [Neisseria yangbaofengii]|uniref:TetR/AcrR family transcriptional regulator n=1 Tax=Neisseria yangbaofengii TaxID=2709396 RepID=UPI0013EC264E|nr:TetR/AcrR family transcriptional regulator [Neisseria yangbaofengii]
MSTSLDPRAERTLLAIETAFIELMQEMDFDEITTQAIIKRANVNRNTFYKYYYGKQGLAKSLADRLKNEYEQMLNNYFSNNFQDLIQQSNSTMFSKRHFILTLWRINSRSLNVFAEIENMIKQRFIQYAQAQQADQNWDFIGEMFAKLLLNSARYYWERDEQIPIKQVFADWDLMLKIATHYA